MVSRVLILLLNSSDGDGGPALIGGSRYARG